MGLIYTVLSITLAVFQHLIGLMGIKNPNVHSQFSCSKMDKL